MEGDSGSGKEVGFIILCATTSSAGEAFALCGGEKGQRPAGRPVSIQFPPAVAEHSIAYAEYFRRLRHRGDAEADGVPGLQHMDGMDSSNMRRGVDVFCAVDGGQPLAEQYGVDYISVGGQLARFKVETGAFAWFQREGLLLCEADRLRIVPGTEPKLQIALQL